MTKAQRNFWLDAGLLMIFMFLTATSFIIDPKEPGYAFGGLSRPAWVGTHALCGVILLISTIFHISWHWTWVKSAFRPTVKPKPKKVRFNRGLDICLAMIFFLLVGTGLCIWPARGHLGPGDPVLEAKLWLLTYHDWKFIHAWGAVLLLVLIIFHLALHWKWIINMGRSRFKVDSAPMARLDIGRC